MALADPAMKARLADLGGTVLTGSSTDLGKLIAAETEKWGKGYQKENELFAMQQQAASNRCFGSRAADQGQPCGGRSAPTTGPAVARRSIRGSGQKLRSLRVVALRDKKQP